MIRSQPLRHLERCDLGAQIVPRRGGPGLALIRGRWVPDEAALASFPASDAPSLTCVTGIRLR